MPDHLPPRVRSAPRATAPYPTTPVRQFSFTNFSTNNPTTPQPGNNIDSEYDRSNASISQIINWLGVSLNTDGTLRTASVGAQQIAPGVFDYIATDAINQVQPLVDDAQAFASSASASSTTAQVAATAANTSNTQAQGAASTAQTSAGTAATQAQAANSSALAAGNAAANAANDANDTAGDVAICTDYGVLTQAWAEHMPDPIPPNILAVMGVTGDHWSSRWWATKAEAAFGSLTSLYLGVWPAPPTHTATGDPIPLGAIYYNSSSGQAFVWDGTEWVPLYKPAKAYALSLLYRASAGQTTFPLNTLDLGGNSYTIAAADPEPIEVYVNGVRTPQNAATGGNGDWDLTGSSVIFTTGLLAGSLVQVDVLTPVSELAPSRVQTQLLLDFNINPATGNPGQIDGVTKTFPLALAATGHASVSVGSAQEMFVSLDGVVQQPGVDFNVSGSTITFTEAPVVGARSWATWYGPGLPGTGPVTGYLPLTGGGLSGPLTLAADPTTTLGAATKHYVDTQLAGGTAYLPLGGGALTGPLTLPGNAASALQAVPLQQLTAATAGGPFLPTAGGILTGPLTLSGPPTSALNPASKSYVDNAAPDASNVINVLNHGAKGDGTTDDTAAIQAALNAYAGKATVFIPNTGSPYMLSGALSILSNTDLVLDGTLLLILSTNIGGVGMIDIRNRSNISIRGVGTVDGNNATQASTPACAGLSADTTTNLRVSGITIQKARFWNLNITNSSNVVVNGVTFHGGGDSIEFADGCDSCWFVNCIADCPTVDLGFGFYGGVTNSGMIGNVVRGGATGIFVLSDSGQPAPCHDILIANNICYNNFSSGIDIDTSVAGGGHSNVVVSNNRVYNNNTGTPGASAEIWIGAVTNGLVTGNLVSSTSTNSAWGIGINSGSSQINVVGNAIFDIGSSTQPGMGLYVNSAALVEASGNTFRGPAHMTSSIGGTAGTGNSFSGNFSGAPPVTITTLSDTVVTSVGNSYFSVLAGTFSIHAMMQVQNTSLVPRWFMGNIGNAESGSDTGSDFGVYNCHDAGGTTGAVPLGIKRSTGVVTLAVAPTITTLPTNAANDAAAATAGVPVGGVYRNGSVTMIRVS